MPHTRPATPHEGVALSEISLPPADTRRWVARRKAQVVEAIQNGQLTLDEAWRRYRLGVEEFGAWKRALFSARLQGERAARSRPRRASPHGSKDHG